MDCNERIRALREDRDLTQTFAAGLLHVGQKTYSDYELGKTRMPLDSVIFLARTPPLSQGVNREGALRLVCGKNGRFCYHLQSSADIPKRRESSPELLPLNGFKGGALEVKLNL